MTENLKVIADPHRRGDVSRKTTFFVLNLEQLVLKLSLKSTRGFRIIR